MKLKDGVAKRKAEAIGRLIVRKSRVHSLEIDELSVRHLRVGKLIVDDELCSGS